MALQYASPSDPAPAPTANAPLPVMHMAADKAWMDFNGHMNVAAYAQVFDDGLNAFLETVGVGETYRRECGGSVFVVQSNILFQREVLEGECLFITLQILDMDAKSLHLFLRMINESRGIQAATAEMMTVHVDMTTRRSAPFPKLACERLEKLVHLQRCLSRPVEAGRAIAIRHRRR
ncbi:MAG: thioesterase family protein [Rhodothalassiaceae bacterium]